MFCPNCGNNLNETMDFCPQCGQEIKPNHQIENSNTPINKDNNSINNSSIYNDIDFRKYRTTIEKNCKYLNENNDYPKPTDFKWAFLIVLAGVVVLVIGLVRNGSTFFESNYIHIVNDYTSYIVWGWGLIIFGVIVGVIIFIKSVFDKNNRDSLRQENERLKTAIENEANNGNPKAIFELGTLYYYGYHVKESDSEAIRLFNQAYSLNIPQAAYYLGLMHERGWGVETDCAKAFSFYHDAINLAKDENETVTVAYSKIGEYYKEGKGGVPVDDAKAFNYFSRSVGCKEFKSSNGYYYLGLCYLNGIGCEQDSSNAKSYLKKAADMGHDDANRLMLNMYDGKY